MGKSLTKNKHYFVVYINRNLQYGVYQMETVTVIQIHLIFPEFQFLIVENTEIIKISVKQEATTFPTVIWSLRTYIFTCLVRLNVNNLNIILSIKDDIYMQ